jgi:hypothetical protein
MRDSGDPSTADGPAVRRAIFGDELVERDLRQSERVLMEATVLGPPESAA